MNDERKCSCGTTFKRISDAQYKCPNCGNGMILINTKPRELIKLEPMVSEDGIYVPIEEYVYSDQPKDYRCVMTKEIFIEAYKKYILEENSDEK
jgi:predicted RNA-binding Zn-ribbon protein involved in translation (DUF1610 family)